MAAACLLSETGCGVTLLEQKRFLGGRAYSFTDRQTGVEIDNGQHLFFGCFTYTLAFLKKIGALDELTVFERTVVPFKQRGKRLSSFGYHRLPFPFHLIFAVLSLRHLSLRERFGLLRVGSFLYLSNDSALKALEGQTIREWLIKLNQSEDSIRYLWEVLAVAIMNEGIDRSSAFLFAAALKEVFTRGRRFSKMIIPRSGLSKLYVDHAVEFLRERNAEVQLGCRVRGIEVKGRRVTAVHTGDGRRLTADVFVLAVPWFEVGRIVPELDPDLSSSPILSVHLWLDAEFVSSHIPDPFFSLIGTRIQWLFNKSLGNGSGLVTLVVSDAANMVSMTNDQILDVAVDDLTGVLTGFDRKLIRHYQIIRERRATFSSVCGSEAKRCGAVTHLENLYLCGDWTDTGLPATVEGAAKSAYLVVDAIRKHSENESGSREHYR